MSDTILVLDEGTGSTRAMAIGADGACLAVSQREISMAHPRPGWVEQDAGQIWTSTLACARDVMKQLGKSIRVIGITNQRETIVFWDRKTGEPLAPAIVWQDRRTSAMCRKLRDAGEEPEVQAKTGLLLDPYFSATKIAWALQNWPQLKEAGERLAVGTIESWLIFKLTGGLHITDATNASRTMLMDLKGGWDEGLCDLFGVSRSMLPEIVDSAGELGVTDADLLGAAIPICGIAGDQQAATIGQACFAPGETKATFGTGAFVLAQGGPKPRKSGHRLLSTVAWQLGGERSYALEGSLFVAGQAIKWLRDSLGILETSSECAALAESIPDSGGVMLVPAFAGLGAPHWYPNARAAILGLSLGSGRAEIARAALEGVANQVAELKRAFAADGIDWSSLRIDGGMAANDFLAQDLADLLGIPVERPANVETTALGAAMLAAVGCDMYADLPAAAHAMRGEVTMFEPTRDDAWRSDRLARWDKAVAAVKVLGG